MSKSVSEVLFHFQMKSRLGVQNKKGPDITSGPLKNQFYTEI